MKTVTKQNCWLKKKTALLGLSDDYQQGVVFYTFAARTSMTCQRTFNKAAPFLNLLMLQRSCLEMWINLDCTNLSVKFPMPLI